MLESEPSPSSRGPRNLRRSSISSNFADKNESKTTVLNTSMDITIQAQDVGNDIGLKDSTSSRQSVLSIGANDTKVSNSGSLSRKQHCPHWAVSYTRLIGHFNNVHFNNVHFNKADVEASSAQADVEASSAQADVEASSAQADVEASSAQADVYICSAW
ncbi:hypothetical protein FHG87_016993 [Trinorchestia longiramus]|nr:hypothetical protein FHG87_016993 [Trinorchestia longiramus]